MTDLRKIGHISLCVCSITLILVVVSHLEALSIAGDAFLGNWVTLTNLNTNSFHAWRLDHFSQLISWLRPNYPIAERPLSGVMILFVSTWFFFRNVVNPLSKDDSKLWIGASLVVVFILITTGLDSLTINSIAWIPAVAILTYHSMATPQSRLLLALLLLVAVEASWSANQTTLLGISLGIWIAYLISTAKRVYLQRHNATLVMLLFPAIVATIGIPNPELPDYPKFSHVLQSEDPYQILVPLIGPAYPIETLDRSTARSTYGSVALALVFVGGVTWGFSRRTRPCLSPHLAAAGTILSFLAMLDTALPESWASIAPIASIQRLLPGATTYSLTSLALTLSAWLIGSSLIVNGRLASYALLPATTLLMFFCSPTQLRAPILRTVQATEDPHVRPILESPSAGILRSVAEIGTPIPYWLSTVRKFANLKGIDFRDLNASITISPAPTHANLEKAKRLESTWRWSPRNGTQQGDELVTIRFDQPRTIRGIELDPGPFYTDYPRGLRIHGGMCDKNKAPLITSIPVWHGTPKLTEQGIPFYAPHRDVRIIFDSPTVATCIFVYQTGQASFDWSISRVNLLIEE